MFVSVSGTGPTATYGPHGRALAPLHSVYFSDATYSCRVEIDYPNDGTYGVGPAPIVRIWIRSELVIDERAYSGVFRGNFARARASGGSRC